MSVGDVSKDRRNAAAGGWEKCRTEGGEASGQGAPGEVVRLERLTRTIEGEIVPRLLLARRSAPASAAAPPADAAPGKSDVRELVRLLLAHDAQVASAYLDTVRQRGATLERVCLDLLAPAARELGLLWEQDECDFMQVTVGLCRLHQLLRELGPEFRCEDAQHTLSRRILLAPCPQEQHTFGITVVAQFLRRAGWDVWHECPKNQADLLELVRQNWFAVVGLSVGSDARLDHVGATIQSIRNASRNRAVGILVGGPILTARPELVGWVGADATAADGAEAVLRAEDLCGSLQAPANGPGTGHRNEVM